MNVKPGFNIAKPGPDDVEPGFKSVGAQPRKCGAQRISSKTGFNNAVPSRDSVEPSFNNAKPNPTV